MIQRGIINRALCPRSAIRWSRMQRVMIGTGIPRALNSPTTGRTLLASTALKTATTNAGAEQAYPLYQSGDGINERMSVGERTKRKRKKEKKVVDRIFWSRGSVSWVVQQDNQTRTVLPSTARTREDSREIWPCTKIGIVDFQMSLATAARLDAEGRRGAALTQERRPENKRRSRNIRAEPTQSDETRQSRTGLAEGHVKKREGGKSRKCWARRGRDKRRAALRETEPKGRLAAALRGLWPGESIRRSAEKLYDWSVWRKR